LQPNWPLCALSVLKEGLHCVLGASLCVAQLNPKNQTLEKLRDNLF
jgi:hypothetical protein